jgi:hypothetical protein
MNLERLTADQDENAGHKRNGTGDEADAQSGECNDPNNNEVNREQKHSDVFSNHIVIFRRSELPQLKYL